MAKKLVYFGLVGALSMSAYLIPYVGAQAAPLDLKYFKEAETIQLFPDTLLIAGIDHMDVDPTGRVLVVDQKGRQAFLFDSTGILQTSLDPTVCHPGFFFGSTPLLVGKLTCGRFRGIDLGLRGESKWR